MADGTATNGNRRKRDREPTALALASGQTIVAAAAAARVSERSVRYWLADPKFQARVSELRTELFTAATGKLADLSGRAVDVLGELLGSESDIIRRQAATDVLRLGPQLRDSVELAEKVVALETVLAELKTRGDEKQPD